MHLRAHVHRTRHSVCGKARRVVETQPSCSEIARGAQTKEEKVVAVNLRVRREGERRGGQRAQELWTQCHARRQCPTTRHDAETPVEQLEVEEAQQVGIAGE